MAAVQDVFRWLKDRRSFRPHQKRKPSQSGQDVTSRTDVTPPGVMQLSRPPGSLATVAKDATIINDRDRSDVIGASDGQTRVPVDRSRLELPPIPTGNDGRHSHLPDISRDCPRSPAHLYDEIPAYAIDSRRDILRYIRQSELRKMKRGGNLDLDRVRDYGAYLVVPVKDSSRWDPDGRHSSFQTESGFVHRDDESSDQLDWFVAPQDQSSIYRESMEFPERDFPRFDRDCTSEYPERDNAERHHDRCWATNNIRAFHDYRSGSRDVDDVDDSCARLETRSEDSGVSSPATSHNISDAMSNWTRDSSRGACRHSRQMRPHSDSDSSLYTSSALDSSLNTSSMSDIDLRRYHEVRQPRTGNTITSDPVRDRRPIQSHVYNVIKEDSQQHESTSGSGPHFRRSAHAQQASLDLNSSGNSSHGTMSDGDEGADKSAPLSDQEYDFYLDKAKENLLLEHMVQGTRGVLTSDNKKLLDSSFELGDLSCDSRTDLTSVTSLSDDLSILADEEIQQLTLGHSTTGENSSPKMAPIDEHLPSKQCASDSQRRKNSDSHKQSPQNQSAFVPYKTGINHRSHSCSEVMNSLDAGTANSPPVLPGSGNGDKLSCRATNQHPSLGARRLSGSHLKQHMAASRRPGGQGTATSQNKMLSEIMKKNHDRQILVML